MCIHTLFYHFLIQLPPLQHSYFHFPSKILDSLHLYWEKVNRGRVNVHVPYGADNYRGDEGSSWWKSNSGFTGEAEALLYYFLLFSKNNNKREDAETLLLESCPPAATPHMGTERTCSPPGRAELSFPPKPCPLFAELKAARLLGAVEAPQWQVPVISHFNVKPKTVSLKNRSPWTVDE